MFKLGFLQSLGPPLGCSSAKLPFSVMAGNLAGPWSSAATDMFCSSTAGEGAKAPPRWTALGQPHTSPPMQGGVTGLQAKVQHLSQNTLSLSLRGSFLCFVLLVQSVSCFPSCVLSFCLSFFLSYFFVFLLSFFLSLFILLFRSFVRFCLCSVLCSFILCCFMSFFSSFFLSFCLRSFPWGFHAAIALVCSWCVFCFFIDICLSRCFLFLLVPLPL